MSETFERARFPMAKDNGCSKYVGQSYYTTRKYDPKRAYPWLTSVTRLGISSNKKQAIEAAINRPDALLRSVSPLGKASNYPSILGEVQGRQVSGPLPYKANVSFDTNAIQVGTVEPNVHPTLESASNLGGNVKKQKSCMTKELAMTSEPGPNKSPLSNKSLLLSGVIDGAPVMYVLKRRKIFLRGVIKGSKILCSCNECNNLKYIGPSKFERHAGGKTKKPLAFMYLENGKTISQVCQELRDTPDDMLFRRLPEIAGSAFRWLSFNNRKRSF